ncbi:hypothetical protein BDQ12DRAFT_673376 [Crucibulum laeve]|uniref:Inhibitor I9 domain-containing protein n=1 Tax=Crucibulum laeve TaxID=68775 RepID=A0A5C3MJ24_9AGAR|nr:hypothetical protein BDQ12DRAFT_673376 [Crucibulum laeve]
MSLRRLVLNLPSSTHLQRNLSNLHRTETLNKMATGKYIVVFKDSVTKEQIDKYAADIDACGGQVNNRLDPILNGFGAAIPDEHLQSLKSLQSEGIIKYIEEDGIVTTQ